MDNIIERARILRGTIEEMAQGLDDSTAESVPELFPEWNPEGCDYEPGDRVRAGGVLQGAAEAHITVHMDSGRGTQLVRKSAPGPGRDGD